MNRILDSEVQQEIAALLAIVAATDDGIATQEIERLVGILQRSFGIAEVAALDMITDALHAPTDHEASRHLQSLGSLLDSNQKEDLMMSLLDVISADGVKEARELELLVAAADALTMDDEAMERAYGRYFESRKST